MTLAKPELKPHPRRWGGLAVLSASLLLVVMDITILNVALPAISEDLRPDPVSQLWMVDVYALVVAGLLVTVSSLGDRWGRKKMLMTGFAVFGLASVLVLWADSPGDVIAIRALLGVGGAMIMPSTLSMIRTLFTDAKERATALGVWAAMAAVGGALGPILGGLLVENFSWHAAFLVNVPVMVVAIVAAIFLLPDSRNPEPGRWDPLATVLSIVGMVALVYAIKHAAKDGLLEPTVLLSAAVAAVTLIWFVRRCLSRPDPLLELRLFKSTSFTAGTVTALTTELAMAGMMLLMAQWMQLVMGYSPLETGLRLLPTAIGAFVMSPLAPSLARKIGARTVLAGGLAVSAIGMIILFVAPSPLGYLPVAFSLLLVGMGMGSLAIASAVIMSGAPAEKAGSAAALEETSYELGGALGVAVLGSVAAAVYRADMPGSDSITQALEIGGQVAERAKVAFTDSLSVTGLAGGVLMLLAALIVWWLTPRSLDLSEGH